MGFNSKDAIESVKDIAINAIERSADIVESAGHIVKGDVSGGVEGIVASSIDIATVSHGRRLPGRLEPMPSPLPRRSAGSTDPLDADQWLRT